VLDLRLIRRDPDAVRAGLARRGPEHVARVDELLALDAQWREATASSERLRSEQKTASEQIAAAKRSGEDATDAIARMNDRELCFSLMPFNFTIIYFYRMCIYSSF
jgi:seryl-tRNA synthetase